MPPRLPVIRRIYHRRRGAGKEPAMLSITGTDSSRIGSAGRPIPLRLTSHTLKGPPFHRCTARSRGPIGGP